MTPLERLLAEAIPTRPAPAEPRPRPIPAGHRWTPEEQAEHRRVLLEALDGWEYHGDRRHLRVVDQPAA